MSEYDVIVVGGGPCGSSAARVGVEKGAKTILLEEHTAIGLPEHCQGRIVGTKSGFLEELVNTMNKNVVIAELKARRVYAPSGRMVEYSLEGMGAKVVERNLFDLELALQAANAGAEIMLSTRVTSLIKEDGIIKGVNTSSRSRPEIRAKVVIAADGIRGPARGIAVWEGLAKREDYPLCNGVMLYLTGVKDIKLDVTEMHLGLFQSGGIHRNWDLLVSRGSGSCLLGPASLEDFERIKNGHHVLSEKIRDCTILRMEGHAQPASSGKTLPKMIKDGLIIAGAAANWQGIDSAIITGRFAGEVAAEAVHEGDVTENKLHKYEELCHQKISYPRGRYMSIFYNLSSDEDIEKLFEKEMVNMGPFACNDVIPI